MKFYILLYLTIFFSTIQADTIYLKNGSKIEGKIIDSESDSTQITVKVKNSKISISKYEIARIERVDPEQAYKQKVSTLKDDDWKLELEMGLWCLEEGLTEKGKKHLENVLKKKPDEERAHKALGHIKYKGNWWTIDELLKSGLCLYNNKIVSTDTIILRELFASLKQNTPTIDSFNKGVKEQNISDSALLKCAQDELYYAQDSLTNDKLDSTQHALRITLDKKRTEALSIIYDTTKYKSTDAKKEVIQQVEKLTKDVESIWYRPFSYIEENNLFENVDLLLLKFINLCIKEIDTIEAGKISEEIDSTFRKCETYFTAENIQRIAKKIFISDYNDKVEKFNGNFKSKLTESEWNLIAEINSYREMFGLKKLYLNKTVNMVAKSHSEEMKKLNYFSHESPVAKNKTIENRLKNLNLKVSIAGEVLARGSENIMHGLKLSPGHNRTLLLDEFVEFGIGRCDEFWTIVLARIIGSKEK